MYHHHNGCVVPDVPKGRACRPCSGTDDGRDSGVPVVLLHVHAREFVADTSLDLNCTPWAYKLYVALQHDAANEKFQSAGYRVDTPVY